MAMLVACAKTVQDLVQNQRICTPTSSRRPKGLPAATPRPVASDVLHSSFPPTVEVYHELSMQRTIVEIQARDEIGLLYRLAKIIYDQGFDITFARIGTERGIAIDSFYIETRTTNPIQDTARLNALPRRSVGRDRAGPPPEKSGERRAEA